MKVCPNCKYERTIQDNLLFPDYECPSCGIIFEKDKARQELAELEKQREKERLAKQKKLKKEEERKRKEEEERLRRENQKRKEKEEAERLQKLEAERLHQEELDRKRKEEEDRLQKENLQRKEKEEAERLQKLEAERLRQEEQERQRKAEEKRRQQEAEERQRQEQKKKEKQAEEAEILLTQRQKKIEQLVREHHDTIISPPESEKAYQLFDMCPFGMAQTGKGLSIVGFGETKGKGQHARCMQKYCRLWTWKNDERGEVYAQGCSLQFLGLSKEEITKNFSIKNTMILDEEYPLHTEKNIPEDQD